MDPEGATLLEKSEDLMLAREAELDQRLKGTSREPWKETWQPERRQGGKGKKGKGKDKGKGKVAE